MFIWPRDCVFSYFQRGWRSRVFQEPTSQIPGGNSETQNGVRRDGRRSQAERCTHTRTNTCTHGSPVKPAESWTGCRCHNAAHTRAMVNNELQPASTCASFPQLPKTGTFPTFYLMQIYCSALIWLARTDKKYPPGTKLVNRKTGD